MNIIFSDQDFPFSIQKSIFLAGPSPRNNSVFDWKIKAIRHLEDMGYDGTVFLPIIHKIFLKNYFEYCQENDYSTKLISQAQYDEMTKDSQPAVWDYDNQVQWECKARNMADVNLFWVERYIKKDMPGFTTNIEFGEDLDCGKMVYGRPDDAEKCNYLDKRVDLNEIQRYNTLEDTIGAAIKMVGSGSYREAGEVYIPLLIWNTQEFQNWYSHVKKADNRLDFAELKYIHTIPVRNGGVTQHILFAFIMNVHVWIAQEERVKYNEFIFSRKDISTIIPIYEDESGQKHIVLIKEFRTPVNNTDGYVWELPGGSSFKPGVDPKENAAKELGEETGLFIKDVHRFIELPVRQLVATLSIHRAHPYLVHLNREEFEFLCEQKEALGEVQDTERTYVKVVAMKDLFHTPIDHSMLGMIFEAVNYAQ